MLNRDTRTMDFSTVELSGDDWRFRTRPAASVRTGHRRGDPPRPRDRRQLPRGRALLALGAAGYLHGEWTPEPDGGFTWSVADLSWRSAATTVPWVTWGNNGSGGPGGADLRRRSWWPRSCPKVFSGEARMCPGYTEPEGGSDIATRQRPARSGDGIPVGDQRLGRCSPPARTTVSTSS